MAIDPTITTAGLAAVEKAINATLKYDPGSQQQLASLHGYTIKISTTAPELCCFVSVHEYKIQLKSIADTEPDAAINGPLNKLVSIILEPQYSLAEQEIRTSGNIQVLNTFQSLLKNLDIDWEAIISQFAGDIVGHNIATLGQSIFSWCHTNSKKFSRYLSEFIQEDLNVFATAPEIAQYAESVDKFRAAVDRLNARIEQLNEEQLNDKQLTASPKNSHNN